MLAYINGSLEEKTSTYVVIDVGGLGYKVYMSENAIDKLGEIGEIIKVHTYYQVREDDISIFGFITSEELKMFELLISVSGVGAKSALSILANISPSSFAFAIISDDVSKLVKIPGVGKKTAARIILELKDKLKTIQEVDAKPEEVNVNINSEGNVSEAIAALQVLGYNKKEVERVVRSINTNGLEIEDIIKKGLILLSK